jgi:hypothetical protein
MTTNFIGSVSIFLGGAVAHSAVATSHLHGTIYKETEKAVEVTCDSGDKIWFPKSALKPMKSAYNDHGLFELARWFKLDTRQENVIDRNLSVNGMSA